MLYAIGVKLLGRGSYALLIVELNSFMKSSDVQSGPGIATIFNRDGGSGVGISEACGDEEKKDEILFLDR